MPGIQRLFLVAMVAIITLAVHQLVHQATRSVPLAQAGALFTLLIGGFLNLIYVSLERIRLQPPQPERVTEASSENRKSKGVVDF